MSRFPDRCRQFGVLFWIFLWIFSGTVSAKELPRKILALYKASEKRSSEVNEIYQLAQLPLNNLGLVVRYANAEAPLPPPDSLRHYRGILTWFISGEMRNAHRYRRWLQNILQSTDLRVVILGHFGAYREFHRDVSAADLRETQQIFSLLGLQSRLQSWDGKGVTIVSKNPKFFDYETPLRADQIGYFYDMRSASPQNRVLLRLKRGNTTDDAAVLFPRGGFVQNGAIYKLHEASGRSQFYLNPFAFFDRAFALHTLPVVDLNTLGGKRMAFIHLDGDGFSIISKIDRWHTCAALFKNWVLDKYDLPMSISIIEGEINPKMLGNPTRVKLARKIFALPNVEAASHGLAHPFDWRTGKVELDSIPHYHFDPEMEIAHSLHYINRALLPPGKFTRLFFWTGMCDPTADQIAIARKNGFLQINGGGGRLDARYPSISDFYPPYAQVGTEIRFNARASNEYEFTNLWQPPHDGFKHLIETLKFSEKGFRRVPADIYFHYYSMEVKESWGALRDVLNFARHQDWNFVRTSQYVEMAQDFLTTQIDSVGKGRFCVHTRGHSRTIRFRNERHGVDLTQSVHLLGFSRENKDLLVFLDGSPEHCIVLGKGASFSPFFSEFNRPVDSLKTRGAQLEIWADGYGRFVATLQGLPPKKAFTLSCATGLSAHEYRNPGQINWKEKKAQQKVVKQIGRSTASGALTIRLFLKNRSFLEIRPAPNRAVWTAKIRFWILGTLILGLSVFQIARWQKEKPPQNDGNKTA